MQLAAPPCALVEILSLKSPGLHWGLNRRWLFDGLFEVNLNCPFKSFSLT